MSEPTVTVVDHAAGRWLCRIRTQSGYTVDVAEHGDMLAIGGSGGAWTPPSDLPGGRQTASGHEDADHVEITDAMMPSLSPHEQVQAAKTCKDWAAKYPHFADRLCALYWSRPDVFRAMMIAFIARTASAREIAKAVGVKRSTLALHMRQDGCDVGQRGSQIAQRARRSAERTGRDAAEFNKAMAWAFERKGKV